MGTTGEGQTNAMFKVKNNLALGRAEGLGIPCEIGSQMTALPSKKKIENSQF